MPAGSGHPLFDGHRIFINAPQYHWHAHGAEGVDTQARDHLTALAEQLFEFGRRSENREQELWQRLQQLAHQGEIRQMLAGFEHDWFDRSNQFRQDMAREVNEKLAEQMQNLAVREQAQIAATPDLRPTMEDLQRQLEQRKRETAALRTELQLFIR